MASRGVHESVHSVTSPNDPESDAQALIANEEDNELGVPTEFEGTFSDSHTQPTKGKKRKTMPLRSSVWMHFDRLTDKNGNLRVICKHCKKSFPYSSKSSGTSSLKKHAEACELKNSNSTTQSELVIGAGGALGSWKFDESALRKAIAYYLVIDELPLKHVEKAGFRRLMSACCPRFRIPSRFTIARDIIEIYEGERVALRAILRNSSQRICNQVKDSLIELFKWYEKKLKIVESCGPNTSSSCNIGNETQEMELVYEMDEEFYSLIETDDDLSDLDRYLKEKPMKGELDILKWWKQNTITYPILSEMARDVLAVPISTVASESAFSTGGRVLNDFRSSLSPRMVETLICSQDWFKSSFVGDEEDEESVQEMEKEFAKFNIGKSVSGSQPSDAVVGGGARGWCRWPVTAATGGLDGGGDLEMILGRVCSFLSFAGRRRK